MQLKNNLKYQWPSTYPGLLLLSLLIGFTGSAALFTLSIDSSSKLVLAAIAAVIALSYNQNIIGFRLRSVKGLKSFTIALVSVITAVCIPVADYLIENTSIIFPVALYTVSQFFFIAALCIVADIRDISEDKVDKIKTFPVAAGESISKKIVMLLLSLQMVILFIVYQLDFINIQQLEMMFLIAMMSMLVSYHISIKNSYYYFILVIDGLIACQTIGLIILSY